MQVKTAVRMGLVVQNPDGSFSDAPTGPTGTANPQDGTGEQDGGQDGAPEGRTPDGRAIDDSNSLQVDAELGEAVADFAQGLESIGASVGGVISEVISNPEAMPASVLNLARDRKLDEGQVFAHLEDVKRGLADATEDFVLKNSTLEAEELEAFWEHAQANSTPAQFSRAITNLLQAHEPRPLLELIAAYQRRAR